MLVVHSHIHRCLHMSLGILLLALWGFADGTSGTGGSGGAPPGGVTSAPTPAPTPDPTPAAQISAKFGGTGVDCTGADSGTTQCTYKCSSNNANSVSQGYDLTYCNTQNSLLISSQCQVQCMPGYYWSVARYYQTEGSCTELSRITTNTECAQAHETITGTTTPENMVNTGADNTMPPDCFKRVNENDASQQLWQGQASFTGTCDQNQQCLCRDLGYADGVCPSNGADFQFPMCEMSCAHTSYRCPADYTKKADAAYINCPGGICDTSRCCNLNCHKIITDNPCTGSLHSKPNARQIPVTSTVLADQHNTCCEYKGPPTCQRAAATAGTVSPAEICHGREFYLNTQLETILGNVYKQEWDRPFFYDWDRDGDLDIIIGRRNQAIKLWQREQGNTYVRVPDSYSPFTTIEVGNYAAPVVADLDQDGNPDLIVGTRPNGVFFCPGPSEIYNPTGTAYSPIDNSTCIQIIENDPSILPLYNAKPAMIDYDGDSDLDMFVGRDAPATQAGRTNYYTVLYFENMMNTPQTTGYVVSYNTSSFVQREQIAAALNIEEVAGAPHVADWDGDTDLDLIVGGPATGAIYYFERLSNGWYSRRLGSSDPFYGLSTGDGKVAYPVVQDWNGDGFQDLLIFGNTPSCCMGNGPTYVKRVAATETVDMPGTSSPFMGLDFGKMTRPTLANWDHSTDGSLELIMGTRGLHQSNVGRITFYKQRTTDGSWELDTTDRGAGYYLDVPIDTSSLDVSKRYPTPSPCTADWDGDNNLDLIVGTNEPGKGLLYYKRNLGVPPTTPGLEAQDLILQTGADNTMSSSYWDDKGTLNPQVADWDNDGDLDLIVYSHPNGICYFEQTAPAMWASCVRIINEDATTYNELRFPCVVDWNGDGFLDLFVGTEAGEVKYYVNDGATYLTETDMTLNADQNDRNPIIINDAFVDVGDDAAPAVADIDGNGAMDVIAGSMSGDVSVYLQGWCESPEACSLKGLCHPRTGRCQCLVAHQNGAYKDCSACAVGYFRLPEPQDPAFCQRCPSAGWSADESICAMRGTCNDDATAQAAMHATSPSIAIITIGTGNCTCNVPFTGTMYRGTSSTKFWNSCQNGMCPAGAEMLQNATSRLLYCEPCSPGKYKSMPGNGPYVVANPALPECTACSTGMYSNVTGETNCHYCENGKYQPNTGMEMCWDCMLGTYSIGGASDCTPCEAGKAGIRSMYDQSYMSGTTQGGMSECVICDAGRYAEPSSGGTYQCNDCQSGKYSGDQASSCTNCAPGKFQNASYGSGSASFCYDCDAGRYATQAGRSYCAYCPAGQYSTEGATVCQNCDIGRESDGNAACKDCAAGYYSDAGTGYSCMMCATGFYSHTMAALCSPCEAGKFANLAHNCTDCAMGYVSQGQQTECYACAAGRYGNMMRTNCEPCQPGTYTDNPGATMCMACTNGTISREAEEVECTPCEAGKYADSTGNNGQQPNSLCKDCQAGRYSGVQAAECTNCLSGYAAPQGSITCTRCEAGKIVTIDGSGCDWCPDGHAPDTYNAMCMMCAAGTYRAREDQTNYCTTCPAGQASGPGADQCTDCTAGSYALNVGSSMCEMCPPGMYSFAAAITCQVCLAGFYSEGGRANCEECTEGRYSMANASYCDACEAGRYSAAGAGQCTNCDPGNVANASSGDCHTCEPGRYANISTCIMCTAGRAAREGSMECLVCPAGRAAPEESRDCLTCAGGTFAAEESASCGDCTAGRAARQESASCQDCAKGQYAPENSITCSDCTGGRYSATMSATCTDCTTGRYSNAGAGDCIQCAAGKFAPATATQCTDCPSGRASLAESETCDVCVAGRFAAAGSPSCQNCAAGSAAPAESGACTVCLGGRAAPEMSATCTDCQEGTVAVGGTASCTDCQAGSFSPPKASVCTSCEGGRYSAPRAGSCILCAAGKYALAGATTCLVCSAGSFAAPGTSQCLACPNGWVAPTESEQCTQCGAGKYASQDQSLCISCAAGKAAGPASMGCTNCDGGKYAAAESAICSNCEAGTFSAAGAGSCNACAAGRRSRPASFACEACPDGWTSVASSENCTACTAGKYAAPDASYCISCERGRASGLAQTQCQTCQGGKYAEAEATVCSTCPAGMYSSVGAFNCNPCEVGRYSAANSFACTNCDGGRAAPANSSSCSQCEAGKVSDGSTASCSDCPAGTYAGAGSSLCKGCPDGEASAARSETCTQCSAGKTASPDRSLCVTCDRGRAAVAGSVVCSDCGGGRYAAAESEKCSECLPGEYSAGGVGECSPCVAGKYSGAAALACTDCTGGNYSNAGSSACTPCGTGEVPLLGNAGCIKCAAGKFAGTGATVCTNCDGGKKSAEGAASCTDCPAGNVPDGGKTSCTQCGAGKYAESGATLCLDCAGGQVATAGSASCTDCVAGTYATQGSAQCQNCTSGRASIAKSAACTQCGGGTAAQEGSPSCTNCEAGYSALAGSALCTICQAGKASGPKAVTCDSCPSGKYSGQGAAECLVCAAGKYSGLGASECSPCALGYYAPAGSAACVQCGPGSFAGAESAACSPCVAGRSASAGKGECSVCQAGRKSSALLSQCEACKAGEYSEREASECLQCAIGRVSSGDVGQCTDCAAGEFTTNNIVCTGCSPGTFSLGKTDSCTPCDIGKFSAANAVTCTVCVAGRFALAQASQCDPCAVGRRSPGGTDSCTICQAGRYAPAASAQCFECIAGEFAPQEAPDCTQCPLGKYSGPAAPNCTLCAAGKYSFSAGAIDESTCTICPVGTYGPNAARTTFCENCPEGSTTDGTGKTAFLECLCQPGYQADANELTSGIVSCAQCIPGTYKIGLNHAPCRSCNEVLVGGVTPSAGATSTDNCYCPPGRYRLVSGVLFQAGLCEICPVGFYCEGTGFGSDSKTACPTGATTVAEGSTSLSQCLCGPGYYKSTACMLCTAGRFKSNIADTPGQCDGECPIHSTSALGSRSNESCYCDTSDVQYVDLNPNDGVLVCEEAPPEAVSEATGDITMEVPAVGGEVCFTGMDYTDSADTLYEMAQDIADSIVEMLGIDPQPPCEEAPLLASDEAEEGDTKFECGDISLILSSCDVAGSNTTSTSGGNSSGGRLRRMSQRSKKSGKRRLQGGSVSSKYTVRVPTEDDAARKAEQFQPSELTTIMQETSDFAEDLQTIDAVEVPEVKVVETTCPATKAFPAGSAFVSMEISCQCMAGFETSSVPGAQECDPCRRDYYKTLASNDPCKQCATNRGTFTSGSNSSKLCFCKEGFYGKSSGDLCKGCPEKMYCPFDTDDGPLECPEGTETFSTRRTISDCLCSPGWGLVDGECQMCSNGTFSDAVANLACRPCPQTFPTMQSPNGSIESGQCSCMSRFYYAWSDTLGTGRCERCNIPGVECDGGFYNGTREHVRPYAAVDYYLTGVLRVQKCRVDDDEGSYCLGGNESERPCMKGCNCREGHDGFMCQNCWVGWTRDKYDVVCRDCDELGPPWYMIVILNGGAIASSVIYIILGSMAAAAGQSTRRVHTALLRLWQSWVLSMVCLKQFDFSEVQLFQWSIEQAQAAFLEDNPDADESDEEEFLSNLKIDMPPWFTNMANYVYGLSEFVLSVGSPTENMNCLAFAFLSPEKAEDFKHYFHALWWATYPILTLFYTVLLSVILVYIVFPPLDKRGWFPPSDPKKFRDWAFNLLKPKLRTAIKKLGANEKDEDEILKEMRVLFGSIDFGFRTLEAIAGNPVGGLGALQGRLEEEQQERSKRVLFLIFKPKMKWAFEAVAKKMFARRKGNKDDKEKRNHAFMHPWAEKMQIALLPLLAGLGFDMLTEGLKDPGSFLEGLSENDDGHMLAVMMLMPVFRLAGLHRGVDLTSLDEVWLEIEDTLSEVSITSLTTALLEDPSEALESVARLIAGPPGSFVYTLYNKPKIVEFLESEEGGSLQGDELHHAYRKILFFSGSVQLELLIHWSPRELAAFAMSYSFDGSVSDKYKGVMEEMRDEALRLQDDAVLYLAEGASGNIEDYPVLGLFHAGPSIKQFFIDVRPLILIALYTMWYETTKQLLLLLHCDPFAVEDENGRIEMPQRWMRHANWTCGLKSDKHWMVTIIAGAGLCVWSAGVLLSMSWLVYRNRREMAQPKVSRLYAYFVQGYEIEYCWWDVLVKRLDLGCTIAITYTNLATDRKAKLLCYTALAASVLMLHAGAVPFDDRKNRLLDRYEYWGLLVRFMTFCVIQLLLVFNPGLYVAIFFCSIVGLAGTIFAFSIWFTILVEYVADITNRGHEATAEDLEELLEAGDQGEEGVSHMTSLANAVTSPAKKCAQCCGKYLCKAVLQIILQILLRIGAFYSSMEKKALSVNFGDGNLCLISRHEQEAEELERKYGTGVEPKRSSTRVMKRVGASFLETFFHQSDNAQREYLATVIGGFYLHLLCTMGHEMLPNRSLECFIVLSASMKRAKLDADAGWLKFNVDDKANAMIKGIADAAKAVRGEQAVSNPSDPQKGDENEVVPAESDAELRVEDTKSISVANLKHIKSDDSIVVGATASEDHGRGVDDGRGVGVDFDNNQDNNLQAVPAGDMEPPPSPMPEEREDTEVIIPPVPDNAPATSTVGSIDGPQPSTQASIQGSASTVGAKVTALQTSKDPQPEGEINEEQAAELILGEELEAEEEELKTEKLRLHAEELNECLMVMFRMTHEKMAEALRKTELAFEGLLEEEEEKGEELKEDEEEEETEDGEPLDIEISLLEKKISEVVKARIAAGTEGTSL